MNLTQSSTYMKINHLHLCSGIVVQVLQFTAREAVVSVPMLIRCFSIYGKKISLIGIKVILPCSVFVNFS